MIRPFPLLVSWLAATLAVVAPASAQSDSEDDTVRVPMRVISQGPGPLVSVDRGEGDGIREGDFITFLPRGGGSVRGTVVQVHERSAVARLADTKATLEPGTPAETRIPRARFQRKPEPERPTPVPVPVIDEPEPPPPPPEESESEEATETESETPDHPGWKDRNDGWAPGMPLLARVDPVKPRERPTRVSGRFYSSANYNLSGSSENTDSLVRAGTDLRLENPFGKGGEINFDTEVWRRSQHDRDERNDRDTDLRVNRFSYRFGGTRFHENRYEGGRFLQYGMPEFGVLDGFEWTNHAEQGHRFGASVGLMPEPDFDFQTGDDVQVAAHYYWVADNLEQFVVGGGYQKTFHQGDADRDLFVGKLRYMPQDGWNFLSTVWIDYYDDDDDAKDSTFEVTQALVTTGRRFKRGGVDFTYRRLAFPDTDRNEFFQPLLDDEIEDNRYDRLTASAFYDLTDKRRVHGFIGGFNDEDDSGGNGEVGLEVKDLWLDGALADFTVFGTAAQFVDGVGGRLTYSRTTAASRWELMYEIANYKNDGFSADLDDIVQHRVRATFDYFAAKNWIISVYGETAIWDDETSVSTGLFLQRNF